MCLREKKSAQIREILISESAWEEMTCLFAPSLSDRGKTAEKVTKCAVSGLLLRKGSAAARFLRQGVAGFAR